MPPEAPFVLRAAGFLGAHALPLFGVVLLLALAGVAVLWRLGARYGVHRAHSRWPPLAYLIGHMALGLALVAGGAAVLAEIADMLGDGEEMGALDQVFSDALRSATPREVLQVFAVLTHLGDPVTLALLCGAVALVLVYLRQRLLAAGWVLAIAGNALLNPALKRIFERARPVHDHGLASADGWSFPSGHASGSVVAYGMLAYVLVRMLPPAWPPVARTAAVLLASAAALTTGASRVFLQVHYPSDVLSGFASGTAWLAVCIVTLQLTAYRQAQRLRP